jgi:SNF2 family DNA or RNA helicase
LDLPDKVYEKRFVSLTPEQVKAYEEMRRFNMTELEGEVMTSLSSLTALIRLHQISCGHVALDSGETKALKSNRMNELLNVLDEVEGKVIIWASYRFDLKTHRRNIKK